MASLESKRNAPRVAELWCTRCRKLTEQGLQHAEESSDIYRCRACKLQKRVTNTSGDAGVRTPKPEHLMKRGKTQRRWGESTTPDRFYIPDYSGGVHV